MINNIHIDGVQDLYFCGDIHGEFEPIVARLNNLSNTALIVCGDIGMGFNALEYYYLMFKKLDLKLAKKNNHLLMFRGNHDDPAYFDGSFKKYKYLHLVPDYTVVTVLQQNILCIGGATSIDRSYRINTEYSTGRKSYWGDAELPCYDEGKLSEINKEYADAITIVATHTCPSFAYPTSKQNVQAWMRRDDTLSQTLDEERATMDRIFEALQQKQKNLKRWYYGHYHEPNVEQHHGMDFILCNCGELNKVSL